MTTTVRLIMICIAITPFTFAQKRIVPCVNGGKFFNDANEGRMVAHGIVRNSNGTCVDNSNVTVEHGRTAASYGMINVQSLAVFRGTEVYFKPIGGVGVWHDYFWELDTAGQAILLTSREKKAGDPALRYQFTAETKGPKWVLAK